MSAFSPLPGVRYRIQSVDFNMLLEIRDESHEDLILRPKKANSEKQQWLFITDPNGKGYKIQNYATKQSPRYLAVAPPNQALVVSTKIFNYWSIDLARSENIYSIFSPIQNFKYSLLVDDNENVTYTMEGRQTKKNLTDDRLWKVIPVPESNAQKDNASAPETSHGTVPSKPKDQSPSSTYQATNTKPDTFTSRTSAAFTYTFVNTNISWSIGEFHHSLSFSADEKTLAGTKAEGVNAKDGQLQFWDARSGKVEASYDGYAFALFSPVEPDKIIVIGNGEVRMLRRDGPDTASWSKFGTHRPVANVGLAFSTDGSRVFVPSYPGSRWIYEFCNAMTVKSHTSHAKEVLPTSLDCSPHGAFLAVGVDDGRIHIYETTSNTKAPLKELAPAGTAAVSVCAWSDDGRWLATGDDSGDVRVWNAHNKFSITLKTLLPRIHSSRVISLLFLPDSTAFVIVCGTTLHVWDITQEVYISNTGLPTTANNIALNASQKQVAVAKDGSIFLYDLKRTESSQLQPQSNFSLIPPDLVALDITKQVSKTKPDPFHGLYFHIYRGAWMVESRHAFQHVVAIKVLRPGFDSRNKPEEFTDFATLLNKSLLTWYDLKHKNVAALLGISTAFGEFPAIITSWMLKGLLNEYLKSGEKYDKAQLMIGVASGVAYLHANDIVHSDIRTTSVLVDEFGSPCLADPGLLSVLKKSPLMAEGSNEAHRWMAPELLDDSPAKPSFVTDIYALTMTCLEIFTGSPPFADVGGALVSLRILQNRRPARPAGIKDKLWVLWNGGWHQDPAIRPPAYAFVSYLKKFA